MKREDGRKLFRAFLGNSRETAGEQRAMMEQMAAPSRERSLRSMMEHLLSLDETAWYLYAWSRDPLEGRFSREQKLAYGFRAAECGRSEAQLILGKTDVWDIAARMGTPIHAPARGVVTAAGTDGAYGISVDLNHGGGLTTKYAHMSKLAVKSGQTVERGDVIGYVGRTGRATGPHLHYEVRLNGVPTNPYAYLLN